MWNYNEAVEIIQRQEAIFESSDKTRVNFVRQLAEADAEYYSVHALKGELKKNSNSTFQRDRTEHSL
jgi:hypothetical protein